jgi:hypothetical protein
VVTIEELLHRRTDLSTFVVHFTRETGTHGVTFTKSFARRKSVNPAWYLDIDPRQDRQWLTRPIKRLIQEAVEASTATATLDPYRLANAPILRLTPFLEQMGPIHDGRSRKEFWWERDSVSKPAGVFHMEGFANQEGLPRPAAQM